MLDHDVNRHRPFNRRGGQSVLVLVLLLAAAAPCLAQGTTLPTPPPVLHNHELLRKYVWSTVGPEGLFHATLASVLEQWRDAPPEWGTGGTGYAKRWTSE